MLEQRLLPPGIADSGGKAFNGLLARFGLVENGVVLTQLVDRVHSSALPHLLEERHVDFLTPDTPEKVQRKLIRNSFIWHRFKGTPQTLGETCETVCGATPEILEKKYFVLGVSGFGSKLSAPSPKLFILGLSTVGECGAQQPGNGIFSFDVCHDTATAAELSLKRESIESLGQALQPARAKMTVRFRGFRLGSEYSLLGIDYLN